MVVVSLILVNVEEHPVMPGQNGRRIFLAILGSPKISHNKRCILTVSIPTSLQLCDITTTAKDGIVIELFNQCKSIITRESFGIRWIEDSECTDLWYGSTNSDVEIVIGPSVEVFKTRYWCRRNLQSLISIYFLVFGAWCST